jgi:hypothetical protein
MRKVCSSQLPLNIIFLILDIMIGRYKHVIICRMLTELKNNDFPAVEPGQLFRHREGLRT